MYLILRFSFKMQGMKNPEKREVCSHNKVR